MASLLNLSPFVIREWFNKKQEELKVKSISDNRRDCDYKTEDRVKKVKEGALSSKKIRATKALRSEMRKHSYRKQR